jgi:hypothetical protein
MAGEATEFQTLSAFQDMHWRTFLQRGFTSVWLTKYTADQGNCFKRDSNSYSLLLFYLIVMRLWAG